MTLRLLEKREIDHTHRRAHVFAKAEARLQAADARPLRLSSPKLEERVQERAQHSRGCDPASGCVPNCSVLRLKRRLLLAAPAHSDGDRRLERKHA